MSTTKAPLTARHIMTNEPTCVDQTTTIRQLARLFEENEISGCPVVDEEGRVVGVVSKTDLIRQCFEGARDLSPDSLLDVISDDEEQELIPDNLVRVEEFMTENAATVTPATPIAKVVSLMVERRIHRVVVVDEENFPTGIITSLDLLKLFPGRPEGRDNNGAAPAVVTRGKAARDEACTATHVQHQNGTSAGSRAVGNRRA
jgi:CBS domain-containing protein